jgi:PAS domain-containing protein
MVQQTLAPHQETEGQTREEEYRGLFQNMIEGFAYCRMLYDAQGLPVDWIHLDTNPAFERITGLADARGRKATEVIPGIRESNPELFEIFGRVAQNGQPARFETRVESRDTRSSV